MASDLFYRNWDGELVRWDGPPDQFPGDYPVFTAAAGKSEDDILLIVAARLIMVREVGPAIRRAKAKAKATAGGQRTMFDFFGGKK